MGYQLSGRAEADLREIRQFGVSRWGKEQTKAYLRGLRDACSLLSDMPGIGIDYSEVRQGLRRYVSGSHLILYRVKDADKIEIVRVLHQSRDIEPLL